jgi:adenine deaminase
MITIGVLHNQKVVRMSTFSDAIPKAELHIHIEGSLEPELMFEIGKRNKVEMPFSSVEQVRQAYRFHNLQSFLDIYYQGASVLLKDEDFYDMTLAYLEKCHDQNIVHTEMFFDPQTHTARGVPFETVINGIETARREAASRWNISSLLIMCFLRHLDENSAMACLKQALPYRDKIIGIGLDSSELGNPPEKFARVFEAAEREGFRAVAHGGEEGPPEYIRQCLDVLRVSRIDHGVRSIEDKTLVERLAREQIPLTVCPLSNIRLCVFGKMEDHSIFSLLGKNVLVTVNSDDPAYFGGYLNENFATLEQAFKLDPETVRTLTVNGFKASFLPQSSKEDFISKVRNFT